MRKSNQKNAWHDFALVGLFTATIFLPAVLSILPWQVSNSQLTEKRLLNAKPAMPTSFDTLMSFPERFNRFFDDHFPLRTELIQRYNYLRIKIMKQSDQRDVLMGRDGWLFYTRERQVQDFIGQAPFTEEKLKALQGLLESRRDWLAARGIAYLFVIPPGKPTIYPEYMPDNYLRSRGRTRLDQIMDHMERHSDVTIVDLRPSLLAAKSQHLLFHRHDSHWNTIGSLVAYGEIMQAVSRALNRDMGYIRTGKDFYIRHRDRPGGDLADILALGAYFSETEPYLVPKPGFRSCARMQNHENYLGREWSSDETPFAMHCSRAESEMVMFRDSFAVDLVPHLSEHFRRSTYVWKWDVDAALFKAVVRKEKPQIVIDECGERRLYFLETGPGYRLTP